MPEANRIPRLSVVMLLPDGYESRRRAISFLQTQTIRGDIELVLVTPAELDVQLDPEQMESFGSHQVVKLAEFIFPGQGFAAGVRAGK